jgi:hypothetical protein
MTNDSNAWLDELHSLFMVGDFNGAIVRITQLMEIAAGNIDRLKLKIDIQEKEIMRLRILIRAAEDILGGKFLS